MQRKEEICLSSDRGPVLLRVWDCTGATRPQSAARPAPVHGGAGRDAGGAVPGSAFFGVRWRTGWLHMSPQHLVTVPCATQQRMSSAQHQDEATTAKQESTVQVLEYGQSKFSIFLRCFLLWVRVLRHQSDRGRVHSFCRNCSFLTFRPGQGCSSLAGSVPVPCLKPPRARWPPTELYNPQNF